MSKKSLVKILKSCFKEIIKEHKKILNIFKALENHNRVEILNILEKEGGKTITQLQKRIKIDYKSTFFNVKSLKELNLIVTHKNHKKKGRPVTVELSPYSKMLIKLESKKYI